MAVHLKIWCNIPHCILISWQICGGDSFNFHFHFHFHLSGGPVEKRRGGGKEEKLQPGGALQEHRAGDNDDVMNDDCEEDDDDAAIRMVMITSLQLSRSWRIGSQFSKPSCAMRKIGARFKFSNIIPKVWILIYLHILIYIKTMVLVPIKILIRLLLSGWLVLSRFQTSRRIWGQT